MKRSLIVVLLAAALLLCAGVAQGYADPWAGKPGGQMDELVSGRGLTEVGWVYTWIENSMFYVKYEVTNGGMLAETHLHLGEDLEDIPHSKGGPIPGKFAYGRSYDPMVTEDTYAIPVADLPAGEFRIAAHAVVSMNGTMETAWGTGCFMDYYAFPGRNWARYFRWNAGTWGG